MVDVFARTSAYHVTKQGGSGQASPDLTSRVHDVHDMYPTGITARQLARAGMDGKLQDS